MDELVMSILKKNKRINPDNCLNENKKRLVEKDEEEDIDTEVDTSDSDGSETPAKDFSDPDVDLDSDEEVYDFDVPSPVHKRSSSSSAPADSEESSEEEVEDTPASEKKPVDKDTHINPLDNPYAVNYGLGEEVTLRYSNGTDTEMQGVVDGYDTEGFYRIKWSNGLTTNGITDIALAELVATSQNESEEVCICGSSNFITEGKKLVCDVCGRVHSSSIRSEVHPMSTATKPSINETIRKTFSKKSTSST